jgi:peroxiredoxin
MKRFLVLVAFLLLCPVIRGKEDGKSPTVGAKAPEIIGKDVDGKTLKLSGHKGKVILLRFAATWCPYCQEMTPHLRELLKRYKDKPFVVLEVNEDSDPMKLRKAIQEKTITWRCWTDNLAKNGRAGPICRSWDVKGYPTIFIIDKEGTIRHKGAANKKCDNTLKDLLE